MSKILCIVPPSHFAQDFQFVDAIAFEIQAGDKIVEKGEKPLGENRRDPIRIDLSKIQIPKTGIQVRAWTTSKASGANPSPVFSAIIDENGAITSGPSHLPTADRVVLPTISRIHFERPAPKTADPAKTAETSTDGDKSKAPVDPNPNPKTPAPPPAGSKPAAGTTSGKATATPPASQGAKPGRAPDRPQESGAARPLSPDEKDDDGGEEEVG